MAIKGRIVKLEDCENPYIANHITPGTEKTGEFEDFPTKGECFIIMQPARYFRTSVVDKVLEQTESFVLFKTMNSIYKLTYERN